MILYYIKKSGKSKNEQPSITFVGFLKSKGCYLKPFGSSFGTSWRYVGSSWPLLGHLGAKMANKRGKMATKSAKDNLRWRT